MIDRHPLDVRLPALLRSGKPLHGIFTSLPSPAIVEMCGFAGFDFIVIDNEHGASGLETTENMLRAARASGIVPIVRCLRPDISRVLDMGASAVQVPMVESVEEARDLVAQVRYPGVGRRGSSFSSRAAGYGAYAGAEHTRRSNESIVIIPMLESMAAIEQAGAIAALDGVEAVFVGPNDLSHSMGFGTDFRAPEVEAAIERALRAIAASGACPGIIAMTPEDRDKYSRWGARYFATVAASLITRAFKQAAETR